MAGEAWLPVDGPARTLYRVVLDARTAVASVFPDAVADCALTSGGWQAMVSCWDGRIYLLAGTGKLAAKQEAGGPARLAWSDDGAFAVAGTADGRLLRMERSGKLGWSRVRTQRNRRR